MKQKTNKTIEDLISKIDNDFNPDNTDWIPRVAAWAVDAMNQLKVLRTKRVKVKYPVSNRYVIFPCDIEYDDIRVFDENNCKIDKATMFDCDSSMGKEVCTTLELSDTVSYDNSNDDYYGSPAVADLINSNDSPDRYNVNSHIIRNNNFVKNYVIVGGNKIELNYDAKFIYLESNTIETIYSQTYKQYVPVIPNNGMLLEALSYYCIMKMLMRGHKHQVFSLSGNNQATNPYIAWERSKSNVKASVIIDEQDYNNQDESSMWQSMFMNYTFRR